MIRTLHKRVQAALEYVAKKLPELKCDACDAPLGYMWENDLNGSYFFCEDCVEKEQARE